MKSFLTTFVFLITLNGFSQNEIGLVAGVSNNINFSDGIVNCTIFSLGTQLVGDRNTSRFYLSYLFEGRNGVWPIYTHKSHYLGLTYEFRLLGRKKVGLYLSPSFFTEVHSNNYDRRMDEHGTFLPDDYKEDYSGMMNRYKKTPLFMKLLVGGDVRVTKNVFFNFALGYGFKIYEHAIFNYLGHSNGFGKFHMLSLQMGVNYSISLSKRDK